MKCRRFSMGTLKGIRNGRNLLTAFAGESRVRNRCTFYVLSVAAALIMGMAVNGRPVEGGEQVKSGSDTPSSMVVEQTPSVHTNRLARETSPYLLQHAHNPVDWYPWGKEALRRAREENKPILLSIGYSACHWCHVMERESFEDPEVAKVLNASFVAIKVDREERPDLDQIYMTAVQMMTGTGGWPLNVFLTPDLRPFHGGTYFPPEDRFGRPGFKKLLERVAQVWRENPDEVLRNAEDLTRAIRNSTESRTAPSGTLDGAVLVRAVEELGRDFDSDWGGFGNAPKFPPTGAIAVLLRQYLHTGEAKLLEIVTVTLDRMAFGGIYDQLGGGFHRYSTDEQWLVPHFEKMLYDNALLAWVYLEAWQATGEDLYRRVATETLDYVLRDMTDQRGGFHSAEDADSEGKEGKFYVWCPNEIKAVLGDTDGGLFCEHYGVTEAGSFDGRNVLHVPREPAEFARANRISPADLGERLTPLRRELREAREGRVRPGKDDKIIAAWNGMMISAFARGYQVLGEERFLKAAEKATDFVLTVMVRDGALLRTYRGHGHRGDEGVAKLPAYLDDYAEMANALVDLYETTFDLRWLNAADELARKMVADFWDEQDGGFFYTSAIHKDLLVRTKPYYDGAVPSGNATATLVLLRLSKLLDNATYYGNAELALRSMRDRMAAHPQAYLNLLCTADFYLHPTREIVIVGRRNSGDTQRFLETIHGRFVPNKVLALAEPDVPDSAAMEKRIPLLSGKRMISGKAAVYVCENYTCKRPVTDAASLKSILDSKDASAQAPGTMPRPTRPE